MKEELRQLLTETLNRNLYQIILSNARDKEKAFKIKIRPILLKDKLLYQETVYQGTKVFHENYQDTEILLRVEHYLENDFKQCEIEHTDKKAVILVSKKGKMTIKTKQSARKDKVQNAEKISLEHNRVKKYILAEGIPVPFLIDLGVQSKEGKIIRAKYDKYKQINRFLEFVEDIIPALPKGRELQIVDFGCGKSYLTFAIYYYLHELKGMDVAITGLDLKEDVIVRCNELSRRYGYDKLKFIRGDIAEYEGLTRADMVVTLHACDTATDFALEKAIRWDASVILSVPCCQHEVNKQIQCEILQPAFQYGIVKERMSALLTDALRADILKAMGYDADLLEFIDMEHTPKNILIRAVKKPKQNPLKQREEMHKVLELMRFMQIEPILYKLLSHKITE